MVTKSKERNRRPSLDELDKLMKHYFDMRTRGNNSIPMPKIIAFALFSTRRQEEITRIRWDDLDCSGQAILVRDMKSPGQKIGNDVWCHLPDEAWAILHSMPKVERAIFHTTLSLCSRPLHGPVHSLVSRIFIFMTCGMKE